MPSFHVRPLARQEMDLTFGVAALRTPGLDRANWTETVRRLADEGGLLGLFIGDVLFGFAAYREHARNGATVLELDPFLTVEVNAAAPGRRALCEAAEALARARGCDSTEVRLDAAPGIASSRALEKWQRLGLRPEALVLHKGVGVQA